MPWRIPSALPALRSRGPNGRLGGDPSRDENAAALWPRGWADTPAGVKACADCWEELHGLYEDQRRWEREVHLC